MNFFTDLGKHIKKKRNSFTLDNETKVKWHAGVPKFEGRYLVSILLGGHRYIRIRVYRNGGWVTGGEVYAWAEVPAAAPLPGYYSKKYLDNT